MGGCDIMKWVYNGRKLTYWYNDCVAYHTNEAGEGVFKLHYGGISWSSKQLCDICDFSLKTCHTLETKTKKFRKWLKENDYI